MTAIPVNSRCRSCDSRGRICPAVAGSDLCSDCNQWRQAVAADLERRLNAFAKPQDDNNKGERQ